MDIVLLIGMGGDSGMAVAVGGIAGAAVDAGWTVDDGLGAMVGTSMVGATGVVGATTAEGSEHANPARTINNTLMVKTRRRPILNKYKNFKRSLNHSGHASQ